MDFSRLRDAAAGLLLAWARKAAPHYGPSGSMDLDLRDTDDAQGPSYYNQFAHYAFLLLAEGVVPGATPDERRRFRAIAVANIRYILSLTDADFHTPHYSRGRDWGRHIGEWLNYYLLDSLQLMQRFDVAEAELRQQLERSIDGATQRLVARFDERFSAAGPAEFPGNHATWHGLLCQRAGEHFHRPAWVTLAAQFFDRYVVPTQRRNGAWPEGEGIVVNYAMVTAQAVSLFAEATADAQTLSCMGRCLSFFQFFSLPDGSSAVVADGRMRYHRLPMVFLPPSFLRSTPGRQLCLQRIEGYRAQLAQMELVDNAAQGLAFFASFCAALMAWPATTRGESATPVVEDVADEMPVARVQSRTWHGFLSWQLTPEHSSRFILDTQNYVELWHADSGYLVGTGNSKYMPRFSTIRRVDGGRAYLPDQASCQQRTPTRATTAYQFGADCVILQMDLEQDICRISGRLENHATGGVYEAGLLLALRPEESVYFTIDEEPTTVAPKTMVERRFTDAGAAFVWRGRTFEVPAGATLSYPLIPHNPYTQHGLPTADAYVGRLSWLLAASTTTVTIR